MILISKNDRNALFFKENIVDSREQFIETERRKDLPQINIIYTRQYYATQLNNFENYFKIDTCALSVITETVILS
jgi:hypothetical protein